MLRLLLFIALSAYAIGASAQISWYHNREKPVSFAGTPYTVFNLNIASKLKKTEQGLLFVNTQTGQSQKLSFPHDLIFRKIEQVKIDSLSVNHILLETELIHGAFDENQMQLSTISANGSSLKLLTPEDFFIHGWTVNEHTATLLVWGFADKNNNQQQNKSEKQELLIYSLKTLELQHRIDTEYD